MEEYYRKQGEKEAEQNKREIAKLKASRENAERALAALKDKHEKTAPPLAVCFFLCECDSLSM